MTDIQTLIQKLEQEYEAQLALRKEAVKANDKETAHYHMGQCSAYKQAQAIIQEHFSRMGSESSPSLSR
jgi:hypothetical protein